MAAVADSHTEQNRANKRVGDHSTSHVHSGPIDGPRMEHPPCLENSNDINFLAEITCAGQSIVRSAQFVKAIGTEPQGSARAQTPRPTEPCD